MSTVKTGISMDSTLFDHVNKMAEREHIPRSQLFARAVREYLERHENQWLLNRLNKTYEDGGEVEAVQRMRDAHRALVKGEW